MLQLRDEGKTDQMYTIDKEGQVLFAQAQGTKAENFYLATLYSWFPVVRLLVTGRKRLFLVHWPIKER